MKRYKAELIDVEKEFSEMVQKVGVAKAFKIYAAPDGVILREGKIIRGKDAIANWYNKEGNAIQALSWEPDFVDVSETGDLGYTYGSFILTTTDSIGRKKESTGKFHTVWKRQHDGKWRFVYD